MNKFLDTTKFRFLVTSLLGASSIFALVTYYGSTAATPQASLEEAKSLVAPPSRSENTQSYRQEVMEKARKIGDEVRAPAEKLPLVQAFRLKVATERKRFEQARNKLDRDVYASKATEAQLSAAILTHNRAEIDDLNVKLEKSLVTAQASGVALNESYKTYMNALQTQVEHIDALASEK